MSNLEPQLPEVPFRFCSRVWSPPRNLLQPHGVLGLLDYVHPTPYKAHLGDSPLYQQSCYRDHSTPPLLQSQLRNIPKKGTPHPEPSPCHVCKPGSIRTRWCSLPRSLRLFGQWCSFFGGFRPRVQGLGGLVLGPDIPLIYGFYSGTKRIPL